MPLSVHCPEGCVINMPRSKAGRVVRCPECKLAMLVPDIPESELSSDIVTCYAKRAKRKEDPGVSEFDLEVSGDREMALSKSLPTVGPSKGSLAERRKEPTQNSGGVSSHDLTLGSDGPLEEATVNSAAEIAALPIGLKTPKPLAASTPVVIDLSRGENVELASIEVDENATVENIDWGDRLERANADRVVLSRFFAICLCLVAIVNVIPAMYHWYNWTQLEDAVPLQRWIYLQIFVGAIYLLYALFLAQIPDWSSMRAVSMAMLAMAFVFGSLSTGLLIGGGQSNLTGILELPYSINRQACIWCVAMLCLATLMAYWGGKESLQWQQAEKMLAEIIGNRTAA